MNKKPASHLAGLAAMAIVGALVCAFLLVSSTGERAYPVQAALPAAGGSAGPQAVWAAPSAPNACVADAAYNSTLERTRFCVYYNSSLTTLAQATTVADQVDDYWDRYVALGFSAPLSNFGGETKMRVQIVAGGCNGVAWENYIQVRQGCINTSDEEMQHTQGHELFHRVQFNYDADWYPDWAIISWFYEGTARMMEDEVFTNIDHWPQAMSAAFSFNEEVNNYLVSASNDLTSHPMRYKSALWWKYFAEQFGTVLTEPQRGVDAIRRVWEAVHPASDITAINNTLAVLSPGMTFDKAFRRFVVANWAKGLTGLPDSSYYYDDEREAGNPAPYGPITPNNGGTINGTTTASWPNQTVSRYGARYYKATIGTPCPVITAAFHRDSGPDAFYHIVTQKGSAFAAHLEGSGSDWTQSFLNDGITQIVAIIGGQGSAAQVDVSLSCANPSLEIKLPNSVAVAYAGSNTVPAKFLAQVLVTNASLPGSPVVTGLTNAHFAVQVNGVDASVTGGGFIQEGYWLVIQAPAQTSDGTYDLKVSLQSPGGPPLATATNPGSVVYSSDLNDQVLVIDRSGSMSEYNKMPSARDAANLYVDVTQDKDGLAVIGFDDHLNPPAPFPMQTVDPTVRDAAHTFINALTPAGMTSIGIGLQEAINQRNSSKTGNPRCSIVLLSDGMENYPPMYADIKADLQALGCPVTTIALGPASDETLLQQIASDNGGLYFYNDVFISSASGP